MSVQHAVAAGAGSGRAAGLVQVPHGHVPHERAALLSSWYTPMCTWFDVIDNRGNAAQRCRVNFDQLLLASWHTISRPLNALHLLEQRRHVHIIKATSLLKRQHVQGNL